MAKNRSAGASGNEIAEVTPSRARKIVSRGDAPSAAMLGNLLHATIADNLTGGLTARECGVTFSGVRTLVTVARNRDSLDELCEVMVKNEAEQKERRAAELQAELAALRNGG